MSSNPLIVVSDAGEPLRLWPELPSPEDGLRLFEVADAGEDLLGEKDRVIRSLAHMASAITSQMSVAEVLQHIVDEAKALVGAQKIVMSVSGSIDGDDLDARLVRGSREELPEEWWRKPLEKVAETVVRTGTRNIACTDDVLIACVPLSVRDHRIGWLGAIFSSDRGLSEEDALVLAIVGTLAGSSIENARLSARARRALIAEEHDRVAREMHDGLSQMLFGVALQLRVAAKHVDGDRAELAAALERSQDMIAHAMSEARRCAYDLRPTHLERLGLAAALRECANEMSADGTCVRVEVRGPERDVPLDVEKCLYRVSQEAITNAMRHANASVIEVTLEYSSAGVGLRIRDDGKGFKIDPTHSAEEDSLGLRSMRERVQAVGGRFAVATSEVGTTVEAKVALDER